MNGRTHLMAGIATGMAYCAYLGRFDVAIVGVAIVGALIPDIDHPQSLASGIVPGASMVLSLGGIRHRGFTHSALFVGMATGIAWLVCQNVGLSMTMAMAFGLGILSHIMLDMMTSAGVPVLYPFRVKYRVVPRILSPVSWLIESLVQTGLLVGMVGCGVMLFRA